MTKAKTEKAATKAKTEKVETDVIDTRAEGEGDEAQEFANTRLSEQVTAAAREATRTGDHARHAGLHALESAIGDFKRACATGAPFFAEDSVENAVLLEIVNSL